MWQETLTVLSAFALGLVQDASWDTIRSLIDRFRQSGKISFEDALASSFLRAIEQHNKDYDDVSKQSLNVLMRRIERDRFTIVQLFENYDDPGRLIQDLHDERFQQEIATRIHSAYTIGSNQSTLTKEMVTDVLKYYRVALLNELVKNPELRLIFEQTLKLDRVLFDLANVEREMSRLRAHLMFRDQVDEILDYLRELAGRLHGVEASSQSITDAFDIQHVLDRKSIRFPSSDQPMFFRSCGPLWVDLQAGMIAKRTKLIELVSQKLSEGRRVVMLKGPPGSGKSVALRILGYQCVEQGKKVCLLDAKTFLPSPHEIKGCHFDLVLIDNAHHNLLAVEHFLSGISAEKVVIATRPIAFEQTTSAYPILREFYTESIGVSATSSFNELVELYMRVTRMTHEQQAEVTNKLAPYRGNLWLLAWAMKAFSERGDIKDEFVFDRIKDWMITDLAKLGVKDAPSALFPVALASRYEVWIPSQLLTEFLHVDASDVRRLVQQNEMQQSDGMLALHHSSLAELIARTVMRHSSLASSVKRILKDVDGSDALFLLYARSMPECACELVFQLNPWGTGHLIPEQNVRLISLLLDKCADQIKTGIRNEANLWRITCTLAAANYVNRVKCRSILSEVDAEIIIKRIENATPIEISYFLFDLRLAHGPLARTVGPMAKEALCQKLQQAGTHDVIDTLKVLYWTDLKLAKNILSDNGARVREKLENYSDPEELLNLIRLMSSIDLRFTRTHLLPTMKRTLESLIPEGRLVHLSKVLRELEDLDESFSMRLFADLEERLADRLRSSDTTEIALCFENLPHAMIVSLLKRLGPESIRQRFVASADLQVCHELLEIVFRADMAIYREIIDGPTIAQAKSKAGRTSSLEVIGRFYWRAKHAGVLGVHEALADTSLILNERLAKLEDIGDAASGIYWIGDIRKQFVVDALRSVDLTHIGAILREAQDLADVVNFIEIVSKFDHQIATEFTRQLDSKTVASKMQMMTSLEQVSQTIGLLYFLDRDFLRNVLSITHVAAIMRAFRRSQGFAIKLKHSDIRMVDLDAPDLAAIKARAESVLVDYQSLYRVAKILKEVDPRLTKRLLRELRLTYDELERLSRKSRKHGRVEHKQDT